MPVRVGESVALWQCREPMTMRPRRHRGALRRGAEDAQSNFDKQWTISQWSINGQSVNGQPVFSANLQWHQSMVDHSSVNQSVATVWRCWWCRDYLIDLRKSPR